MPQLPRHELSQTNIKKPVVVVRSMPLWTRPHFWDVWIPAGQKPTGRSTGPFGVEVSDHLVFHTPRFAQQAN